LAPSKIALSFAVMAMAEGAHAGDCNPGLRGKANGVHNVHAWQECTNVDCGFKINEGDSGEITCSIYCAFIGRTCLYADTNGAPKDNTDSWNPTSSCPTTEDGSGCDSVSFGNGFCRCSDNPAATTTITSTTTPTRADPCPAWSFRVKGNGNWKVHAGGGESSCWQAAGAEKQCSGRYQKAGHADSGDDKSSGLAWVFDGNGGIKQWTPDDDAYG
jgi:hypothetical protein